MRKGAITVGPGLNGKSSKANRLEPGPQTPVLEQLKSIVRTRVRQAAERIRMAREDRAEGARHG